MSAWLKERRSGVLLHISSLPGEGGRGTVGESAYRFVDFLAEAGFSVWQVLPLGPTLANDSPYQSPSANAGNPNLIDIAQLREWGWLADGLVSKDRRELLAAAYRGFLDQNQPEQNGDYRQFCDLESWWLDDFALFEALKTAHDGAPWWEWPEPIRDRHPEALEQARAVLAAQIGFSRFVQFVFDLQWHALRRYANDKGVSIFGDLPIFVAEDAVDVWVDRELFELDAHCRPVRVAGVPPDYFSATGQRWGNPLYAWDRHEQDGYRWWTRRMQRQLALYDILRIDHFRGFEAYWAIPAACETAIDGSWIKGPGADLFDAIEQALGTVPVVAEDLGIITPAVDALRDGLGYPGMKILQFAFDGRGDNPYLPHNVDPVSVIYSGTHDNDTTTGWYEGLTDDEQEGVRAYFGNPAESAAAMLQRAALASVSRLAIIPAQDLLELGSEARMNTPGLPAGNWRWQLKDLEALAGRAAVLRTLNNLYARTR